MISLVSLLVAAALISQQCGFEANAQIENSNLNNIDNSLQPNVVVAPKRPRRLKKFVHIFSAPDEEVRREIGERTVLECVAMGNPPPSVRWERNGETVQDFEEEVNEILPSNPAGLAQLISKLVIITATPGEDQYTCVATAGVKKEIATTTVYTEQTEDDEEGLLILQKLLITTSPIITYYYNEIFQDIGSVTVLPCRAQSFSKAQVYWTDSKDKVIRNNPRMRVLPSGDLMINGVRWSDMGNFTCAVKNMYGKDAVNTFIYPVKP